MTDDFLTIVVMSSVVIGTLIFLFKGKNESKSFFEVIIIVAIFLLTLVFYGVKSLF
jgi:hypothetical protein